MKLLWVANENSFIAHRPQTHYQKYSIINHSVNSPTALQVQVQFIWFHLVTLYNVTPGLNDTSTPLIPLPMAFFWHKGAIGWLASN